MIANCLRQRRCGRLKKCFALEYDYQIRIMPRKTVRLCLLGYGGKGGERVDQKVWNEDESQCAAVTTSRMKANAPVSLVLKRNNHMRNAR